MRRLVLASIISLTLGCSQFGFSSRTLMRTAAPDGRTIFVCQEVPELDGPGHEWRLERPDGTILRRLFLGSDGNGQCDVAVWSADGNALAVAERNTIHVADVAWALSHPNERKAHWFIRRFRFDARQPSAVVTGLRFSADHELKFELSGVETSLILPVPLVSGRAF
jgi:hypothetical protein